MPERKAGKPQRPIHPGQVVRGALEALGANISIRQHASAMGLTHAGLNRIVNEEVSISAPSALRIAAYLGNEPEGAELFMSLQAAYDLHEARQSMKTALAKIKVAKRPRD